MAIHLTASAQAAVTDLGLTRADIAQIVSNHQSWEEDVESGVQRVVGSINTFRLRVTFLPRGANLEVIRVEEV